MKSENKKGYLLKYYDENTDTIIIAKDMNEAEDKLIKSNLSFAKMLYNDLEDIKNALKEKELWFLEINNLIK